MFKVIPGGTLTTLYSFCSRSGCADGSYPAGALVQDINGDLYGTTEDGGASGDGTVFKITLSGSLTTLHSFGGTDGSFPNVALAQGVNGSLYGTTAFGGTNNAGTVFEITTTGTLTTLYNFCSKAGCADGSQPAGLVQDTNGIFYGTTSYGGTYGYGTVFSLSVGLGPFVIMEPTSGAVEAAVKILGTGLTGATSVTFNGTPAAFTVVSSAEITTTVPAGATTGKVEVVIPTRTLSSNVPFLVP